MKASAVAIMLMNKSEITCQVLRHCCHVAEWSMGICGIRVNIVVCIMEFKLASSIGRGVGVYMAMDFHSSSLMKERVYEVFVTSPRRKVRYLRP